MEHVLTEPALTFLRLETLTQLMTVDSQLHSQMTDVHVGMLHEVVLGLEALFAAMLHSLLQDLVIAIVVEVQVVGTQVVGHILCHGEVRPAAVLRLHVVEDHLLTIADDRLHQQALDLVRR